MSIRKAKKQFFRNESKFLAKGLTCIDYISPNTVDYVVTDEQTETDLLSVQQI